MWDVVSGESFNVTRTSEFRASPLSGIDPLDNWRGFSSANWLMSEPRHSPMVTRFTAPHARTPYLTMHALEHWARATRCRTSLDE